MPWVIFFLIINLFQEKKSSVFNESPLMANPALFNVDAEDGLAVLPFADQTFRFRFYCFSGIKFLMGTAMEEVLKPATFSFSQSSILYTQSQW